MLKLTQSDDGLPIYVNPTFVVSVRPKPGDPENSFVQIQGENFARLIAGTAEEVVRSLRSATYSPKC